jgi:hypothetical protein
MIYAKIASVKSEIGTLTKKSDNPFYKSKYLELSDLLEAVEPLLHSNGLVLMQPIVNNEVRSEIYDIETGEVTISSIALPTIQDPQKLGSAITYFRRYTLQSLLSLQAVDDDANITVKQTPKAKPVLSAERFQDGLDKVNADKITKEQFVELCGKYELNDTQKKSIELIKKI